jgi:hypothetical protein
LGHLDRTGYLVALVMFLACVVALRGRLSRPTARPALLVRYSTYARWLPKVWFIVALLAFLGGLLYSPDNFDYLTYRFPRVLHWCWDAHWSWLDTPEGRQNYSAIGMEWLMTPLFVLFHTDRLFFLINAISFLFLPGLIFAVFRQAGVSGRIAWSWMWLLPLGFCFILQAASMGNDSFAAVYFLAALHYAYRARLGSPFALALSFLSIALMTGSKASNMPLVLPWLAVLVLQARPSLRLVRPLPVLGIAVLVVLVSFFPMALINLRHTGSYTGDPHNIERLQILHPVDGVIGNSLIIFFDNLAPPVWPQMFKWPWQDALTRITQLGSPRLGFTGVPIQVEETSGIGIGLVLLSLLGLIYGSRAKAAPGAHRSKTFARIFAATVALAWLVYMAKLGSEAGQRLVAVYYIPAILSLLLLCPVAGTRIHARAWRLTSVLIVALALLLVVLNPARPILPVPWIETGLRLARAPDSVITSLHTGYILRQHRRDELRALRKFIPISESRIGVLSGGDEPTVSLWLPFGSREPVEVYSTTTNPAARNLRYIAVSGDRLTHDKAKIEDLLKKWSMTIVTEQQLCYTPRRKAETWYLLRATP